MLSPRAENPKLIALRSRLPGPAPPRVFISQSIVAIYERKNQSAASAGSGDPREGWGPGWGPHCPPTTLGHLIDTQEGSEKQREKKEVKTAPLLATGSKCPPSLPSSFLIFK